MQAYPILLLWIVDISNIYRFLNLWREVLRVILLCEWFETYTRFLTNWSACCGDYLSIYIRSNAILVQELLMMLMLIRVISFGVNWIIFDWHIYHFFLPLFASSSRMRVAPQRCSNGSRVVSRRLEVVVENLLRTACVWLPSAQIATQLIIARPARKLVFTLLVCCQIKQLLLAGGFLQRKSRNY